MACDAAREMIKVKFTNCLLMRICTPLLTILLIEVDLRYSTTLHTTHNSYPLAPERLTIEESMISPLQKKVLKHQRKSTTKFAPNLMDKRNYVLRDRYLKYYLAQGIEVTKYTVHIQAISMAQSIH